ncbi:hypothetical protein A0130_02710 [Leifsonia xyli]|uniref:sensor histidine kinase n=1 Tax=Leifsonia xyli TaxID=1575 RepID=UPI0007CDF806|nr:hypothetical protein A0130_02710 [Leifsonia xyli]
MRRYLTFSFTQLGAAVAGVVAAVCLLSEPPQSVPRELFVLVVLLSAGIWTPALLLPTSLMRWRVAGFALYGLAGAVLDLWQPWGPGFVAGFVAVSAIALSMPPRPALLASIPVLVLVAAAEAVTSDHPWNALLNIVLGLLFFFAASSFAALKRDATVRAEQLLRQEAETRKARDDAAALGERARLARELHDVLAHTLSGLSLQLEAARLLGERTHTDPRVLEQLALAQKSARDGVAEGKRAIAALRGEALANLADLPTLVTSFSRDTGIPARLHQSGEPVAVDGDIGLAVFRTVQESLSNVRKHAADSRSVAIELRWSPDEVVVSVRNAGSAPSEMLATGFGLSGLAERAQALGGEFTGGPTEDGFETSCSLPLSRTEVPA